MEYSTPPRDLRTLLSVAAKLRHLAETSPEEVDQALYVNAAAALEARARWLTTHLSGDDIVASALQMHRPVDVLV